MRQCDECQLCCKGYLQGTTRGSWFGNLKPCKYLDTGCIIYNDRPSQCRNYFCAWVQGLFPEWMRPDKISIVISVENDAMGKQFLKVSHTKPIDEEVLKEINNFVNENNTYFQTVRIIPIGQE